MARKRTATGCLTCRLRRKKCEEQKPVCTGCDRNHLICAWPLGVSDSGSTSPTSQASGEKQWAVSAPCGDGRRSLSPTSSFDPLTELPSLYGQPYSSSELPKWLNSGINGHLFQNYQNDTAAQMSAVRDGKTPFLSMILPMAHVDERILHSVLAISGAHLQYFSEDFEYQSRVHYSIALRSIKHALLDWQHKDAACLAKLLTATLLMCIYEVRCFRAACTTFD